jgi:hypothetical protein
MGEVKRFIYRRTGEKHSRGRTFVEVNVHLLVGYNQGTVSDFYRMVREMRKTFPRAKNHEIHCGKVVASQCFKGFSIIT